ncbi:MAG TPA: hypothetical protein VF189_05730 [Patescibacteria group bacterium]
MEKLVEKINSKKIEKAKKAFDPKNFGFKSYGNGWKRKIDGIGEVIIAPITWEHAQFPNQPLGPNEEGGVLDLVSKMQQEIWGMPPSDAVPGNVLTIIKNTGGSILVAYELAKGFTKDGALGFSLAFGGRSGKLVSHMLGVRERVRSTADLGWFIKIIQAHEALKSGHTSIEWTFDPMRGANARLNIEKLGGKIEDFTIDKYGKVSSDLYGNVPTDRFTVEWDLLSESVQQRVKDIYTGKTKGLSLSDVKKGLIINAETNPNAALSKEVFFEIPGDIDNLMRENEKKALSLRRGMRKTLSALLNKHEGFVPENVIDPALSSVNETTGEFIVDGFATGVENGTRRNFYRLRRK